MINVYYFFIIVTITIFFIVAFVTANTITLFITITVNITIVFDHLPTKHTASAFKSFFVVINVYILYFYCKSSGFLPSIWIFDSTHITLMALMINDILKFKKLIEFPSLKISWTLNELFTCLIIDEKKSSNVYKIGKKITKLISY